MTTRLASLLTVTAADPKGARRAAAFGRRCACPTPWRWSCLADASSNGKRRYDTYTFRQLEEDSNRLASGLRHYGVTPGHAAGPAGAAEHGVHLAGLRPVQGRRGHRAHRSGHGHARICSAVCTRPSPRVSWRFPWCKRSRSVLSRRFPRARFNVTVGRRLFWDGLTLDELRARGSSGPDLPPDRGRRSGGDHLHHRQHRPAQGRALLPRQLRPPGDRESATSTASSRARSTCPAFRCLVCSTARWA